MAKRLFSYFFTAVVVAAISPRAHAAPPSEADRPRFARVRVGVRDLPSAVDLLGRLLGWTPVYRGSDRVLFSTDTAPLELDAAAADTKTTVVLSVDDVDALYRALLTRGAVPALAPADRPSGYREASVQGPGAVTLLLEGPLDAPPDFAFTELRAGSGEAPGPEDTVKVRYFGTLRDGTVFDGSHRNGLPAMIPLASAIRCWSQALPRMKVGGRARFVCPPEMAYGREGRPPKIPPNAALTFDVQLFGVMH